MQSTTIKRQKKKVFLKNKGLKAHVITAHKCASTYDKHVNDLSIYLINFN